MQQNTVYINKSNDIWKKLMTVDKDKCKNIFLSGIIQILRNVFSFLILGSGSRIPNLWRFCPYVTHLINIIILLIEALKRPSLGNSDKRDI